MHIFKAHDEEESCVLFQNNGAGHIDVGGWEMGKYKDLKKNFNLNLNYGFHEYICSMCIYKSDLLQFVGILHILFCAYFTALDDEDWNSPFPYNIAKVAKSPRGTF